MNRVEFGVRIQTGERREHGTEAAHGEEIIDMLTRLTYKTPQGRAGL
jgi:hypothetical protein